MERGNTPKPYRICVARTLRIGLAKGRSVSPARASQSECLSPVRGALASFALEKRGFVPFVFFAAWICWISGELLVTDVKSKVNAMRIASLYSHLHGREYLVVRRPDIWCEVEAVVQGVDACQGTVPPARSRAGQRSDLSATLRAEFIARGWRHRKRRQGHTDYIKSRVGLGIWIAEAPGGSADMLAEHLASFVCDEIDVGIGVAPMEALRKELDTGTRSFEQGLEVIRRYPRGQPAVPLLLVGIAS